MIFYFFFSRTLPLRSSIVSGSTPIVMASVVSSTTVSSSCGSASNVTATEDEINLHVMMAAVFVFIYDSCRKQAYSMLS